jgi:hypothetical protein
LIPSFFYSLFFLLTLIDNLNNIITFKARAASGRI